MVARVSFPYTLQMIAILISGGGGMQLRPILMLRMRPAKRNQSYIHFQVIRSTDSQVPRSRESRCRPWPGLRRSSHYNRSRTSRMQAYHGASSVGDRLQSVMRLRSLSVPCLTESARNLRINEAHLLPYLDVHSWRYIRGIGLLNHRGLRIDKGENPFMRIHGVVLAAIWRKHLVTLHPRRQWKRTYDYGSGLDQSLHHPGKCSVE